MKEVSSAEDFIASLMLSIVSRMECCCWVGIWVELFINLLASGFFVLLVEGCGGGGGGKIVESSSKSNEMSSLKKD